MLRLDPKLYTEFCRRVRDRYKDTLTKDTPNFEDLLNTLRAKEAMPSILFDKAAVAAVRANNKEKVSLDEETPTKGGNIEVFNKNAAADKTEFCAEYTMC